MDAVSNPYSPGAGLRPGLVAGRQDELDAFAAAAARAELARPTRGLMLTGLRGVGKTVLLNEMANHAEDKDWVVARLEVRPGGAQAALTQLTAELARGLRAKRGNRLSDAATRALRSVKSLSLTIDPSGAIAATTDLDAVGSGDLEVDLAAAIKDVSLAARELGTGVAVFIDEMQELDAPAMAALSAAAHAAGQRDAPSVLVGAGLPNLPGKLADAKSYAEWLFDYRPLGRLEGQTAVDALAVPAADAGARWASDALAEAVAAAGGYPYFLQQFGAATWEVAAGPDISVADARNGIRLGQSILDGGFFRARWDRATAAERRYMQAMAASGDRARTPDVAAVLGREQRSLGPIRAGLIGKGLIYAPEYGVVAFTVPAMADFISRQID
ncbi:MAG TPA: ATP-binding protein [Jatrophihabitans sp.]